MAASARRSVEMIVTDCETDAASLDGLSVQQLGPVLGGMLAMIQALAHALLTVLPEDGS